MGARRTWVSQNRTSERRVFDGHVGDRRSPGGQVTAADFRKGSKALIIGRYSTCCTETRRGRYRSLALAGKLYPTTDPDHNQPLRTANFFVQEDLGGTKSTAINDVELRNAPDTTPWRRGLGLPVLLVTGLVLVARQAALNPSALPDRRKSEKPDSEPTNTPEFMRLVVAPEQPARPRRRPRLSR